MTTWNHQPLNIAQSETKTSLGDRHLLEKLPPRLLWPLDTLFLVGTLDSESIPNQRYRDLRAHHNPFLKRLCTTPVQLEDLSLQ
jgi:hypothetical protein